ncbi:annexin A13-like [Glandiceps talaboti]
MSKQTQQAQQQAQQAQVVCGPNYRGTVKPMKDFDAERVCKKLKEAMKGLGTDEKVVIEVLTGTSNEQRQAINVKYRLLYGTDLADDIRSETSGNFRKTCIGLLRTPAQYNAECMRNAIEGLGTNEDAVIEILCTSSNQEIKDMKEAYHKAYRKDLEKDIKDDTSGHFKKLLVSLLQGSRSMDRNVDKAQAKADAKALYDAGEARWGTDESVFNSILASRSYEQLQATFDEYSKISKRNILQAIDSEMSGDLCKSMKTIVRCVQDKKKYYAERLHKSMKGLGTDDSTLVRIVIRTCEVDLEDVKQVFSKEYSGSLKDWVSGDTSGDYKAIMVALIG